MRLSARLALFALALPFAPLSAQEAALPPALAALRVKAENGNSIAQYNLGLAYAQGREIPADPIEGYVWLNLAAESGTTGKALDTLLHEISPAQLAEGKRRLALRKNTGASPLTLAPLDPAQPDRIAELTTKNQQLTAEIAALQSKLDAVNDASGRAVISAKADANSIADSLHAKITTLEAQLTAAKNAATQAQSAAQAADIARAQLQQQKLTLGETVTSLTAEKNALAAQVSTAQTDNTAPKLAALEFQLAAAKSELTATQSKLTAAAAQNSKIAALEAEIARSSQQAVTLQAQLNEITADRAILKQKLAAGNSAPAPKTDSAAPQIAALQAQVAALTAAKSSTEQKLAAAEARLNAPSPAAAPAASDELAAANTKLQTVLRSFTLAQNENAQLKSAAEAAAAESVSLRQQLAAAMETKSAAPAPAEEGSDLKRDLTRAENKLATSLRSYSLLSAENERLKAEAAARADSTTQAVVAAETRGSADVAAQAAQLAEVREQLRQVQAQSAAYAQENVQFRTRLALAGNGNVASAPSRRSETLVVSAVPTRAVPAPEVPLSADSTPAAERTHTIVAGDTLQGLAKKYYGSASRWTDILAANNDTLGSNQTLMIGRTLRLP